MIITYQLKPLFTFTERYNRTKFFQTQQQSFESTSRIDIVNSLPNNDLITHPTNVSNINVVDSLSGNEETKMDLLRKFRSTHGPTFVWLFDMWWCNFVCLYWNIFTFWCTFDYKAFSVIICIVAFGHEYSTSKLLLNCIELWKPKNLLGRIENLYVCRPTIYRKTFDTSGGSIFTISLLGRVVITVY